MKRSMGLAVLLLLQGCEQPESLQSVELNAGVDEMENFINNVKADLVFIDGGKYLMGDYGVQFGPERLPYDRDADSKPLHEVELSSFSMSQYKITNAEYQFYLKSVGLALRENGMTVKKEWDDLNSDPRTPAHVDWFEAKNYCAWIAKISDLPFALSTEAQWEYAARSRGQFLMVATDDGTYKAEPLSKRTRSYRPKGINISTNGDRADFAEVRGWSLKFFSPLPVDMFAPNPLGLYGMSDNGYEWVEDWYDPDYYSTSPEKDPRGPSEPIHKDFYGHTTKVLRGQGFADPYWGGGVNVHRTAKEPNARYGEQGSVDLIDKTARCVVNSPAPVVVRNG